MTFERDFLKLFAVEAAEFRRQSAERPNQCQLRDSKIDDADEPPLSGKRQAAFGFALHVAQPVARSEKLGVQDEVRVVCKVEIADLVRVIKSAACQINGDPHV